MTDRFFRPEHVSAFRTLAAVTWDPPTDPTIYGSAEIDVTRLRPWLERVRVETGQKVSMTHAVARALASALAAHPELNCTIRRGQIWQRRDVDVFLQVAVPPDDRSKLQGADLSGALLRNADRMTVAGMAAELARIAERIRKRDDPMLAKTKAMLSWMPAWLARPMMRFLAWLNHDWGVDLHRLGVPNDPFGSIMVTSLGMFGIRHAYAPLFPAAKGIGVVLVGGVYDAPVAVDGRVEVRPLLPLTMAIDHRLIDGLQASVLAREVVQRLEDPESLDLGALADGASGS